MQNMLKIIRLGGKTASLITHNKQIQLKSNSISLEGISVVAVQKGSLQAIERVSTLKIPATTKLRMFNPDLEFLYSHQVDIGNRLILHLSKMACDSIVIRDGKTAKFGTWLDKPPYRLFKRLINIFGQPPYQFPLQAYCFIDKPFFLKTSKFQKQLAEQCFTEPAIRGHVRQLKINIDKQAMKKKYFSRFRELVGPILDQPSHKPTVAGFMKLIQRNELEQYDHTLMLDKFDHCLFYHKMHQLQSLIKN